MIRRDSSSEEHFSSNSVCSCWSCSDCLRISFTVESAFSIPVLRLEAAGGLFLKNLSLENEKKIPFTTNGFPIAKHKYYFGAGDPQFIISDIPQGEHTLRFEIEVIREQEARDRFWKEFSRVSAQRDQEIQHLKRQIHEMENTKVWKMYRSIRKK